VAGFDFFDFGSNALHLVSEREALFCDLQIGRAMLRLFGALNGIVIVTFTPLLGMSDVVKLFLTEADVVPMRRLAKGEGPGSG
jgi:hypothetical protein